MMDASRMADAAAAYDAIAPRYDGVPLENRINRYLRRVSLDHLRSAFRPGQRVVELGCGTGDEALDLASRGVTILAVDPSEEMVRVAREKAASRGLSDRVTFHVSASRDFSEVAGASRGFDGAYASFSLAYEPDLRPVSRALGDALRPDARFVASVPSRVCFVEWLLALGAARPGIAGRRLRTAYGHRVGDRLVRIRAYTPASLAKAMAPHFALARWEGLAVLVPPPYLNRAYVRLGSAADAIERADLAVRARALFRSVGDHLLAEFYRVGLSRDREDT